jgi:2-methylisocitrate lyase-like PEP mutase family enzyme
VSDRRARLRRRLDDGGLVVVPGVTNAFHARLATRAGFEAVFVTGAGVANTLLGLPDIGLATMSEILFATERIVQAVDVPVLADADTGYGNHLNVIRTVREFETAGVAAVFLEDQVAPKRCGHFEGKRVVAAAEMVEKLTAAREARSDPDMLLVARTDALAVEPLPAVLERARAYVAAGADMIFVEAPRSEDELAAIPPAVPVPCVVNVVEGGRTPQLPAARFEDMGFRVALYANLALRAGAQAVKDALETLFEQGDSRSIAAGLLPWDERQDVVGLDDWQQEETRILAAAAAGGAAAPGDNVG